MHPIEITDANFEQEVLKSDIPVLIDFWAVWCGPCKMIAPHIEALANEYEGKAKIGKLDVDSYPDLATHYGIRGIPTILIFRDGKVVDRIVGNYPKDVYASRLEAYLQTA
jgi:thioredoxin 1